MKKHCITSAAISKTADRQELQFVSFPEDISQKLTSFRSVPCLIAKIDFTNTSNEVNGHTNSFA